MDPRPPYQQPRYAPFSPHRPSHPEAINFFGPQQQQHHHFAPNQMPPPPPPSFQPYHSIPPPQHSQQLRPYSNNPQNSHISFNSCHNPNPNFPIEGNYRPRSHPYPTELLPSPRGSRRTASEDDRSRQRCREFGQPNLESRPGLWDPRRSSSDNRMLSRPCSVVDLDQRPMSPYRPMEKIRREVEGNIRYREEYHNDGFLHNQREELLRGRSGENYQRRDHFGLGSDRSSMDLATKLSHSSSSRGFELNLGNFENRGKPSIDHELSRSGAREGMSENHRWGRSKEVIRDARDSLIEMGTMGIGDNDGVRTFPGKRDYYGSELERYDRGSREISNEFNRTPRKQVQKKSALLRIQKPSYRNREDEWLHHSGYFDEPKSSSFRGKDQHVHVGNVREREEGREGSPVELDVSFKSNSLVAKAIVTPSNLAIASDSSLTPRNNKIRKVIVSHKDSSTSPVTKLSESSTKSESSGCVSNNASSSEKDLKQSKDKVTCSSIGNLRGGGSSTGTALSYGKTKVGSSLKSTVSGKDDSSGKTPSVKIAKKKKIVKKVVKKVVSSSQPTKKSGESAKDGISTHNLPTAFDPEKVVALEEKTVSAGMASVPVVDLHILHCSPNEATRLPKNETVDGSHLAASEEVGTDVDYGCPCAPEFERQRNGSVSPLGSSRHKETKAGEGFLNGDGSVSGLHTHSNIGADLTRSLNNSAASEIGGGRHLSEKFCKNDDSILLENGSSMECSAVLLHVGGNITSNMLGSGELKGHDGLENSCSFGTAMTTTTGLDNGLISPTERVTASNIASVDSVSQHACPTVEIDIVKEFPKSIGVEQNSEALALSASEETIIDKGPINADYANQGKGVLLGSVSDHVDSEDTNFSSHGISDDIEKQQCSDGVSVSPQYGDTNGSPNSMFPGGCEDRPKTMNKRKVRNPQLDLSMSMSMSRTTDMYVGPVSLVSPAHDLDTTLTLSVKNPCPADISASGVGSVDVTPEICKDEVSDLHGTSSTVGCLEDKVLVSSDVNVCSDASSPGSKKRKVSACHLELSGPTSSHINEGPIRADMPTSVVEMSSHCNDGLTLAEGEVVGSGMDALCSEDLLPSQKETTALLVNSSVGGSLKAVGSVRDALCDDSMEIDQPHTDSCTVVEVLTTLNDKSIYPLGLGGEQITSTASLMDGDKNENGVMDVESFEGGQRDGHTEKEHVMINTETAECKIPSEHEVSNFKQGLLNTDVEDGSDILVKNDLSSVSNHLFVFADGNGVSTTDNSDKFLDSVPGTMSDICSPEILPVDSEVHMPLSEISDEKVCGSDKIPIMKPVVDGDSNSSASNSYSQYTEINLTAENPIEDVQLPDRKKGSLPSQNSKSSSTVSRDYPSLSSFVFSTSKSTASSNHITKPRTWHRTDNSYASHVLKRKPFSNAIPLQKQLPKKVPKFQSTSYIRKGNSLVRKPAPPVAAVSQGSQGLNSSVYRLQHSGTNDRNKSPGSDTRVDVIESQKLLITGEGNTSFERPRTPIVTNVHDHTTDNSVDCSAFPLADTLLNGFSETSEPTKSMEIDTAPKPSEEALFETLVNQTGSTVNLESQGELNGGSSTSSRDVKTMTYVKRKLNQLVATSNPYGLSAHNTDKNQAVSSDNYYKRSKNQLIRTPLEGHPKWTASVPVDCLNSEGQPAIKAPSGRSFKRRYHKGVMKARKPLKLSLVWTLHGAQLSKTQGNSLQQPKVLPPLPWKRPTYWRSFMRTSVSISNRSSLSLISRKLLLSRKRDTVYTRSKHGFSLRKSKVLSVGGSSLKWSKSIEKRSKKANEEATLAVAEVERKRRQQNVAPSVDSGVKNRNHSSRERIIRVNSVRYKMDPSRCTLQRLSDDESSYSAAPKTGKDDAKKPYIPRRLVIGNDEYVRIGNGNQLVRDPKKRTRVLASEKVRWSLHTARLRLAKKRKYCQFFTRFGKCNKDDGKCPYIHDSSKIAVCTKFLNGLCSNSNCKLTHKVIPERMPDCSYFLQGLCANKNCPYRHVHVNPNASTCEGFLRGYCADGNECRKKHTYVCPIFEATGSCPQGSKCKLHHPKKRSKGKKTKRGREQQNAQGRYFGSMRVDVSEPGTTVFEKHSVQENSAIFSEGILADFISLDDSDEEVGEYNDLASEQTTVCDSNPSDIQLGDLDELIKPILIMK